MRRSMTKNMALTIYFKAGKHCCAIKKWENNNIIISQPFDLASTPIYNSDRLATSDLL